MDKVIQCNSGTLAIAGFRYNLLLIMYMRSVLR